MSRNEISPIFVTTTPIRYKGIRGGGTGFFLNYQGDTYLITNRHVVDPEDASPAEARIWFRNYGDITETNHHDISLSGGDGEDWYGHPDSEDIDIAAIMLDLRLSTLDEMKNQSHNTGSLAFTRNHYIYEEVDVDQRVVILGYPGDFVDRSTLFPVLRNALISSPYGQPFDGDPYFITDARMHPGTSGSPILMRIGRMRAINPDFPDERRKNVYLLGVHSATFYPEEREEDNEDNVWAPYQRTAGQEADDPMKYELNVAWYPELIDDIFGRLD